jgi:hypothetical protein
MIRVVHPRIRMLTFYPSQIPGSKRNRIQDPDPEHWILRYKKLVKIIYIFKFLIEQLP